jgi:Domain of unknown function (DUF397)
MRCHNVSDYAVGAVRWRRSSRSYGAGNCVEIAAPGGERARREIEGSAMAAGVTQINS